MTGDIDGLLAVEQPVLIAGADDFIRIIGLGLAGRRDEARGALLGTRATSRIPAFRAWSETLMAWLERRPGDMFESIANLGALKIMTDPEAIFQGAWLLCDVGEHERGLERVQRAVAAGYSVAPTLATAPAFDALRGDARFQRLLAEAEAGRQQALAAFRDAGGERLLGR
jgi:hypothetical protein